MRRTIQLGTREVVLDDERLAADREALAGHDEVPAARWVLAAAHVVMRQEYAQVAHSPAAPGTSAEIETWIDWEGTAAIRRALDDLGFGIAEAMDTAQRFSIGWPVARRLIEATGGLGLQHGFVAGAGADQLDQVTDLDQLAEAVVEQARVIQGAGGIPMILPMPWLSLTGKGADDYVRVYEAIVAQLGGPLLVHWLGEMFLPSLRGYFPGDSFQRVMALDPSKIRGVKLSLLDPERELSIRRELLEHDQIVLTGDDWNFAAMIRGTGSVRGETRVGKSRVPTGDFSHALLGVFDAVALPAALALRALAVGDVARYESIMKPCEELGRILFEAPTSAYKTGLAFLAWLDGRQSNPLLANHEERLREREHLERLAERAAEAGIFRDAGASERRLHEWSAG